MRVLIDTDVFCKLAAGGLLIEAANLLGVELEDCGRLPALPHMLRRGGLRRTYGPEVCDRLIPLAEELAVVGQPSGDWLDRLTPIQAIDPGEAQLFAYAASAGLAVVSGDKRALGSLKHVDGYADALAGRVVVFEALLLCLCERLGADVLRRCLQPLHHSDKVIQVCFSAGNAEPRLALHSYLGSLATDLKPLVLWREGVL